MLGDIALFDDISPFHLSSMLANDVQDLLQGKVSFTCGSLTRCFNFMAGGMMIGRMLCSKFNFISYNGYLCKM